MTDREKSPRAKREEEILSFWQENRIFEKTLDKPAPKGDFVFYEGPPTANGRPGIHHLESRAFKDAIPRYKTMRGYKVPRKAGWDTHGLPVELEVEKTLGLKSKKEIEEYGVAKFNEECKKSVWKYVDEWQKFTNRIGFWLDTDNPYVTYHNSYIESVWSIISEVEKKNLLYKDYKVVPWCPRCGTGLSSHELAQGYADVKDLSVYTKFRLVDQVAPSEVEGKSPSTGSGQANKSLLAWTTTPWTLPGNVALAVGADITYVEAKVGDEILVLAKDRLGVLTEEYEVVAEHKGSEMVGMGYEPLYPFLKENFKGEGMEKAYKVYTADFVNTEDGTGIVHTAVMYGQDDFVLGTEVGLPKHHLVDESGHFKSEAGFLANKFVKDEETAVDIIKDLAHRGLLYKKEKYEHSYPHCWRCKTPLIYYARDSWYIRMSDLREKLVDENRKINWEPDYIKEGRFGEWLREVKDWALSRERYWGTPLPVWISESGKRIVVDSVDTLKKYVKRSGNEYFALRHGEAESNLTATWDFENDPSNHLTEAGKRQIAETAKSYEDTKFDIIVRSPILRAQESAEMFAKEIGFAGEIIVDQRLAEFNPGSKYQGKPMMELLSTYEHYSERYTTLNPEGENYADAKRRAMAVLEEYESMHKGKKMLFITHGAIILNMIIGSKGTLAQDVEDEVEKTNYPKNGEIKQIDFSPFPHNTDFELDLHKPYIDDVVLEKDGEEYKRVKEVMDVWLDSGAMPLAQDPQDVRYPADFISEAIDQTRGWFYTLHAVGAITGRGHAYKNVICLGHLLDKDGKKMSKSIGNVIDPWEMMDKYGVDTLRLWMYSVNQPGESKNFDERTVDEIHKKVCNILDNVYAFYELYKNDQQPTTHDQRQSGHVLDKWIIARLNELSELTTVSLDNYKLLEPVRAMREFVDDLSTWYLRRSRDRLKEGDVEAKETLRHVLKTLSKLLAPFAPFYAEDLFQKLKNDSEVSVHLADWPEVKKPLLGFLHKSDRGVVENMKEVRKLVSLALEQRSSANIKVRQPLGELRIKNDELGIEYLELIKDEVNVKKVVQSSTLHTEVELDTTLTPELEEEGLVREEIRSIQEMRKEKGLKPGDKIELSIPEDKKDLYEKHKETIEKSTNVELI